MTSISKPPIPPNSGVPSIAGDATSTAESQEEDASMTDLFGDEKGEADTIDPLLAAETVTPSSAAAAASSKLALPNGAPKTNGSVSSTAPPSTNAESSSSALPKAVSQFVSLLTPTTYNAYSSDVLMTSSIDGSVALWDRRVSSKEAPRGVGRLEGPERTPKWCMSVSCFTSSLCLRRSQTEANLVLVVTSPGLLQRERRPSLGRASKRSGRHLGRPSDVVERQCCGRVRLELKHAQDAQEPCRFGSGELSRRFPGRATYGLVRGPPLLPSPLDR